MGKLFLAFLAGMFLLTGGLHWTNRHEAKPQKQMLSIDSKYLKPEFLVYMPPMAAVLFTPVSEEAAVAYFDPRTQEATSVAVTRESMHPV